MGAVKESRPETMGRRGIGLLCFNSPFIFFLLYEGGRASAKYLANFKNIKASKNK
jgi:hypothetical protein